MRFWLRFLVGALALVFVLLAAAALFVAHMDPNDYRGTVSNVVKKATGRTLRIGGDLRIRLLPNPSLEANDVTFANAEWASQPDMVRIERLQAEILLAPLLKGKVVVQHFVAIAPQIFLETAADGRASWTFAGAAEPDADAGGDWASRRLGVVLNQVHVENGALDYVRAESGERTEVRVETLDLGTHSGDALALDLRGRVRDLPVTAEGRIGTAVAVLGNEPFPIDIKGSLGDAGFTLEGTIGKPLDGEELALAFASTVPSTREITEALGIDAEEVGPIEVAVKLRGETRRLDLDPFSISARPRGSDARVEGSVANLTPQQFSSSADDVPDAPMTLNVDARLGDARVRVEGRAGKLAQAKDVRLALRAETPSTRPLTELAGVALEELGPVDASVTILGDDGRFDFEDIVLTARPRDTAARVSGSLKRLAANPTGTDTGADAQAAKVDLEGTFGEARFRIAGEVGKPWQGRDMRLKVSLAADSTRTLTQLAKIEVEELGPVDGMVTVVETNGRLDFEDIDVKARPRGTAARVTGSLMGVAADATGTPIEPKTNANAQAAKVDLEGNLGEARFRVDGTVGKPWQAEDLRLKVSLAADSTRPLTQLAEVEVEELGPIDAVVTVVKKDGRLDVEGIDVKARPRDASVTVTGSVDNVTGDPRPDLRVAVSARSLRQLDQNLPAAGPVDVSARIEPNGEVIELHDLVATIGKSDLSGSATFRTGGKRPSASARLRARVIDMRELVPAPEQSEAGVEKSSTTPQRLFSDKVLPFDALKKADADIELTVDRVFTRTLTLDKVDLSAKLDDGNLTMRPAAQVAGGTFGATIGIDARAQPAKLNANVDGKSISLGKLAEQIRGYQTSQGLASDLKMRLTGSGQSIRAIMGALDGDFTLEIGEGRLKNDVLHRVGGDIFMQILGVLIPTNQNEGMTAVTCGVVRVAVKDGEVIADKTLVMQTDKMLLSGSGLIDLKTEQVDAGAAIAARKGIRAGAGTFSSLVRVRGTLAELRLGTDLTGLTRTGVKIGAAVFTAGLTLLAEGLYARVSEDEFPCRTAMERSINMSPSELERLLSLE